MPLCCSRAGAAEQERAHREAVGFVQQLKTSLAGLQVPADDFLQVVMCLQYTKGIAVMGVLVVWL